MPKTLYSAKIKNRQPTAIRSAVSDRGLVAGWAELENIFKVRVSGAPMKLSELHLWPL